MKFTLICSLVGLVACGTPMRKNYHVVCKDLEGTIVLNSDAVDVWAWKDSTVWTITLETDGYDRRKVMHLNGTCIATPKDDT